MRLLSQDFNQVIIPILYRQFGGSATDIVDKLETLPKPVQSRIEACNCSLLHTSLPLICRKANLDLPEEYLKVQQRLHLARDIHGQDNEHSWRL